MVNSHAAAQAAKGLGSLFKSGMAPREELLLASRTLMRDLALPLLRQMGLGAETTRPFALLDSACGTGVMTQEVQAGVARDVLRQSSVLAADLSAPLVEAVQARVRDEGWVNTEARVLDAMDTGLAENSFSHVVIGLGLHLIPRPDDVLKDCQRILKPGGVFGATTLREAEGKLFWQRDMRAAFASLPFEAPFPERIPLQTHDSGRWTDRDWVEGHLRSFGGFRDVRVEAVPLTVTVESPEHFVRLFAMMAAFVMKSWWSEEQRAAHPLEEVMVLVRKYLDEKYGDGSWELELELLSMTATVE